MESWELFNHSVKDHRSTSKLIQRCFITLLGQLEMKVPFKRKKGVSCTIVRRTDRYTPINNTNLLDTGFESQRASEGRISRVLRDKQPKV